MSTRSKFIVLLFMMFLLSYTSSNSKTIGSIIIKGNIPPIVNIEIQGINSYNNLDLLNSVNNLPIIEVTEKSNTTNGYEVFLNSANNGYLVHIQDTSQKISYSVVYAGSTVVLSNSGNKITDEIGGIKNLTKTLNISYSIIDSSTILQGEYRDTLEFTIIAK